MPPILSYYQTHPLLYARNNAEAVVSLSLDLNRSSSSVTRSEQGVVLPDGQTLTWEQIGEINTNELSCYLLQDGIISKIQRFSSDFNRYYSLMPTASAPTMLISGIPMHRIKGTDPYQDTLSKIKAAAPVTGAVLDTTMGLGYTAVLAAQTAVSVTTIELDPAVVEICRLNPWSQELFSNPRISRLIGDAAELVETFSAAQFSRILHDPPTFSLAGQLYGAAFYRQLHRILKPRGCLFHYVGDPQSKSGRSVTQGVVRRLQAASFARVRPAPAAFGVVAYK